MNRPEAALASESLKQNQYAKSEPTLSPTYTQQPAYTSQNVSGNRHLSPVFSTTTSAHNSEPIHNSAQIFGRPEFSSNTRPLLNSHSQISNGPLPPPPPSVESTLKNVPQTINTRTRQINSGTGDSLLTTRTTVDNGTPTLRMNNYIGSPSNNVQQSNNIQNVLNNGSNSGSRPPSSSSGPLLTGGVGVQQPSNVGLLNNKPPLGNDN